MTRSNQALLKTRLGIETLEDRLTPADLSVVGPPDRVPVLLPSLGAPETIQSAPEVDAPLTLVPGPLTPRTVIAVGSPAGSLALARLIDSRTGAEVLRVEPFAGFRGEISVAAGDVNGDGISDLVVGAGAGGDTHVRAFDGATGAELANFLAYRGFNGGIAVAVGDVNGDGFGDIVTGAGAGAPGGHVKVFNVTAHMLPTGVSVYAGADGTVISYPPNNELAGRTFLQGEELASFLTFDSTFRGGVSVVAGDVNRDGFADIITGAGAGAANGHVKALSGRTRELLASFQAYNGFTGGVRVSAADVNGDGVSEVVTQAVGTSHVKVFSADGSTRVSFQSYPSSGYSGFGLATADVNRDGIADIVATGLTSGAPQLRAFRGIDVTPIELAYALPWDILGGIAVG
ncbi:FG-GAP repeat protein [Gemmata sp. SH-PL17]|uniref:FG-GAP repeat domain-containing protein n=1 Tax=Gemmata sp. SH-PL17 TaxID=1630693 RepID=UPI00078D3567|nr:VCBS repeat-containing protein [Gemmata sp. SH-PL17]AMV24943.1 FG-GAP repeat protein [Gemmata sp. SH-PL17]